MRLRHFSNASCGSLLAAVALVGAGRIAMMVAAENEKLMATMCSKELEEKAARKLNKRRHAREHLQASPVLVAVRHRALMLSKAVLHLLLASSRINGARGQCDCQHSVNCHTAALLPMLQINNWLLTTRMQMQAPPKMGRLTSTGHQLPIS